MSKMSEDGPDISPEERERITKASRQLVSYANFLRWAANFKRNEISRHPSHDKVMMLSLVQSGRFTFVTEGDTLFIGVQNFEAVWMMSMPFEAAYISDRLYLSVDAVACMDAKLPPLSIGIFVDSAKKKQQMKSCKHIQFVSVIIKDGSVAEIGKTLGGLGFPLLEGDIVQQLLIKEKNQMKQLDIGRFF